MKKPIKKQSTERDQFTAVLEDIRSHNQVFGEALDMVRDKVTSINTRVGGIESRVGGIETRVGGIENDMQIVKDELALIRYNQVTREEFRILESRVLRLEKVGR